MPYLSTRSDDGQRKRTSVMSLQADQYGDMLSVLQDSPSGRFKRLGKLLIVIIIPVAILIAQCTITITRALHSKSQARHTKESVATSVQLGEIVTRLQRERGMTNIFLTTKSQQAWDLLAGIRNSTDLAIDAVAASWPGTVWDGPVLSSAISFRKTLVEHRVSPSSNLNPFQESLWFSNFIADLLPLMSRDVHLNADTGGELWKSFFAYEAVVNGKECTGIQRAVGSSYWSRGYFFDDEREFFYLNYRKGGTFLQLAYDHSLPTLKLYDDLCTLHADLVKAVTDMKQTVLTVDKIKADITTGLVWYDNMTSYIDLIGMLATDLTGRMDRGLFEKETEAQQEFMQAIALLSIMLIICPPSCVWYLLSVTRMSRAVATSAEKLLQGTKELYTEKRKGDKLLHRMLPPHVVEALKLGEAVEAQHFDSATVYFGDVVGFTKISSQSSALQVVEMLNDLYKELDAALDLYDVYKVETIGDAYLVVSGLPQPNGVTHAKEIATLSLDLVDAARIFRIPHLPGEPLKLRSGIHTGPVLAGVVGVKMPRYCIFGSTILTAMVMEQTSQTYKIQISLDCKRFLDYFDCFVVSMRQTEESKNCTYWLDGKKGKSGSATVRHH